MRRCIAITLSFSAVVLLIGAISLRAPNRLLASVSFSFALAILTVASVAIPHRRGPRRAYWIGFATCGWLYLVLTGFPILDTHVGVHLLTTPGFDLLYKKVAHRPPSTGPSSYDAWADWTDTHLNFDRRYVGGVVLASSESFMQIGHSLFAILAGLVGGFLGRWFHAARDLGPSSEHL